MAQFIGRGHQVQVVVQDEVGKDLQALMPAAEPEGVWEDIEVGLAGEEGEPPGHGADEEVGDA